MPTIKIEQEKFHKLMGHQYSFEELDKLGFQFGIQIEEEEEIKDGINIKSYKFQCMNNRPDLITQPSLIRTLKIYLQIIPTPPITIKEPQHKIIVQSSVKNIRPFVAAAILRNVHFDELTFKSFIHAQEKLHATFCRARKYASIGTHNLDSIKSPFTYQAISPDKLQFVPLNQTKSVNGHGMMELLEQTKLKEYLHLIRDSPLYPVITDAEGTVCSVPPIINSEHSKITIDTKNIFIEVTALSKPKALVCLNTLVWGFSEYCQKIFEVEAVDIVMSDQSFTTPDFKPKQFIISHERAQRLVGAPLTQEQIISFLNRTGMSAAATGQNNYQVSVPAWRSDVLHECDILEDIAICYGYDKIVPVFPKSSTIGARLPINKFSDLLRHEMAQAQFNQALNFALCSKADVTTKILNSDDSQLVLISNAKTKEFEVGRTTLLPGLLKTIVENKSHPLPQKLFELGDCIVLDKSSDTGSINVKKVAAVITDQVLEGSKKEIFANLHGVLDIVMKKCRLLPGKDYHLSAGKNQIFLPGQQFDVILHEKRIGIIGVVHPIVVKNFNWSHPCVMWELDVQALEDGFRKSMM